MENKNKLYESILQKYVAGEDELYRLPLRSILYAAGRNIATNSIFIVSCPAYNTELPNYDKYITEELFYKNINIKVNIEQIKEVLNSIEKVDVCGIIEVVEMCGACHGAGEVEYVYRYKGKYYHEDFNCPVCEGSGENKIKVSNGEPTGEKKYKDNHFYRIIDISLSPSYIEEVINIANILQETEIYIVSVESNKIQFVIGEMEAIIAGIGMNNITNSTIYELKLKEV